MSALPTTAPPADPAPDPPAPRLRPLSALPGPRGWPLVGSLFQLRPDTIHLGIEAWCRQYGTPFVFRIGRRPVLVLADHGQLAALMRDRPQTWRRTQQLLRVSREMGFTPGVFSSEGEAWRRQRRMVMGGLDPGRVRAYFPSLLRVTGRLQRRWQAAAQQGRALDLQPELMRYTVDTVAGLALGADINTLESDGVILQQHLDRIFPALFRRMLAPLPYWRWFKLPADRRLERSVAEVKQAIADFIAAARARLAADPARRAQPPNLLEGMIVAAEDGGGIDDTQVAANVLTMLLAGEDTTANTLAWLLHLLHRHPDELARVRDEVRTLTAGCPTDALTPEHLARLDRVEACLNEAMRLKPVAPFLAFEATQDTQLAGVQIPAGTLVWCAMRHDTHNPALVPEPQAFRPERWLADSPAAIPKRVAMPFGAGPRICPGRYLALTEMKLLLAMLFTHFDIESVATDDGGEAAERMSFTMVPVGLKMRLRERPA